MKQVVFSFVAAAMVSALAGVAAQASTTVSATMFNPGDFQAQLDSFASSTLEDFEGFEVGELSGPLATAVGTFSTLAGPAGSGATINDPIENTGTDLFLRGAGVQGRVNTTDGGSKYLDSNDRVGIKWEVDTGSFFDRLLFTVSDASDTGADFWIVVNGEEFKVFEDGRGDRKVDTVLISFAERVNFATVLFENRNSAGNLITNDGFSLDDVAFAAAVPLPPAVAMLGAGVFALGALRRRRKAAA